MIGAWPDYEREDLEIYQETVYEVLDPWEAKVIGTFANKDDAEMFAKAVRKRAKKRALKDEFKRYKDAQ